MSLYDNDAEIDELMYDVAKIYEYLAKLFQKHKDCEERQLRDMHALRTNISEIHKEIKLLKCALGKKTNEHYN